MKLFNKKISFFSQREITISKFTILFIEDILDEPINIELIEIVNSLTNNINLNNLPVF